MLRIAAGHMAIEVVREQEAVHLVLQHRGGRAEGALHLVEHHALVAQVLPFALIAPALLPEDLALVVNGRVQHRVQIDVHQVEEIPVVPAGDGVHRLVRVGHGVEECLDGALQQLHEGLLHRVLVGPAEHRVLQNVEHTGGVLRQRLEGDGKRLVLVLPVQPAQLGPGLVMRQLPELRVQLRQLPHACYGKSVQLGSHLHGIPSHALFSG